MEFKSQRAKVWLFVLGILVFQVNFFFFIFKSGADSYTDFRKVENQYSSAIVADAVTGEVLYSYRPDMKIFPASLTKIMTAYVAFDALKKGIVGVNDSVTNVDSDKKNNEDMTIKDLLYKLIIKSSNTASHILAQEIFDSEEVFIEKMNYFAKIFDMVNTNYRNTNGLYDKNHYSTARDIAKLSIRLVYDFPDYIDFFGTTNYIDEHGIYTTKTSKIQDNVFGISGGKTGYISASGYNLVVWGKYNNRHLFVVVIGADDRISRDHLVIDLISIALKQNNIEFKKKNSDQEDDLFDKIFNFLGIDYKKYLIPVPIERNSDINKS